MTVSVELVLLNQTAFLNFLPFSRWLKPDRVSLDYRKENLFSEKGSHQAGLEFAKLPRLTLEILTLLALECWDPRYVPLYLVQDFVPVRLALSHWEPSLIPPKISFRLRQGLLQLRLALNLSLFSCLSLRVLGLQVWALCQLRKSLCFGEGIDIIRNNVMAHWKILDNIVIKSLCQIVVKLALGSNSWSWGQFEKWINIWNWA